MHQPRLLISAVAGAAVLATSACASPAPSHQAPPSDRRATTSIAAAAAHRQPIGTVKHVLDIGGYLDGLTVDDGVLWATDLDGDRVARVVAATTRRLPDIAVPQGPLSILALGGSVWVASYQGSIVTRLNARTGASAAVIGTPSKAPCGLAGAGGRLWVVDQSDGKAMLVNTRTDTVVRRVATSAHAGLSTWGFGSVWVPDFTGDSGAVLRLDPATGKTLSTVKTGAGPVSVSRGAGSLWVANANGTTVTRIDPATGHVRAQIELGAGPVDVVVTDGHAWATSYSAQMLYRIDLATNRVDGSLSLPGPAQNMVVAGGLLWVTLSNGKLVGIALR